MSPSLASSREALLKIYRSALVAVAGQEPVRAALAARPMPGPTRVVAIGKAASAMFEGAAAAVGDDLQAGLLITKTGYAPPRAPESVQVIEAGHPIPDRQSLLAGDRLLAFIGDAPARTNWLFLISGGASSLVEVLPANMTLADLQRLNHWLLGSGLPIGTVNAIRRRLSRVKGGGLLDHLPGSRVRALLMSDVPGDDPCLIGSGLLHRGAAEPAAFPIELPAWLARKLADAKALVDVPHPGGPEVDTEIVASLAGALAAAERAASRAGLKTVIHPERLAGDAETTGRALARALRAAEPGVHVWGGETTVVLPPDPGQGGRCQQLALAAAQALVDCRDILLLAAATDGSDGPTLAAGALIDGTTCARGRDAGLDPAQSLLAADAGRFLEASGDLIDTGPTGANVNDLVIALKLAQLPAGVD